MSGEGGTVKKKDQVLQCTFCKKWLKFYNLLNHLRTTHGEDGREEAKQLSGEKQKSIHCTIEGCTFVSASEMGLKSHISRVHPSTSRRTGHIITCPLCENVIGDQEEFNEHCRVVHDDEACVVQNIDLPNEDAFQKWKEATEKGFCTFWREVSTAKRENFIVKYYKCSRAGKYIPRGRGVRVPRKSVIETPYCTSFAKVKIWNDGVVNVRYCTRHCGHSLSVASLPLSKSDKEEIAHYLQLRIPVQSIRRALWRKYTDTDHRLYFTTAADIRNVEASLALQPGRLDDDDLTSIQRRFNLQSPSDGLRRLDLPESGIRKSFCLIIMTPEQEKLLKEFSGRGVSIDDTHCTTRYHVKLSTLMVADNYGRGLEVAFMISYNVDTEECIKLFEVIKSVFPEFHPGCFLSDDTQVFWNAYNFVFPLNNTIKLLCAWHCQRAIFQKLDHLFPKRSEEKLRIEAWISLLFNTCNIVDFTKAKTALLTELRNMELANSTAALNFRAYLKNYYLDREKEWAPYYRVDAIANTTMINERWHRTLKYTYLNRSSNRRIDFLTQVLLEAVPEIIRDHYIKDVRGLSEGKHRGKENIRRHKAAVLARDSILLSRISRSQWQIRSFTREEGRYTITITSCTCASELAHCVLCGVCPTMVMCSCADSVKIGVSCKHAHAWNLNYDESAPVEENLQSVEEEVAAEAPTELSDVEDVQIETIPPAVFVSKRDERKELLVSINARMDRLYALAQSLSVRDDSEELMRQLDNDIAQVESKSYGVSVPGLVPRREVTVRGRCYGSRQKEVLQRRFDKLMKRSSRKSRLERIEYYCESIDTDAQNICAVCHEAEPPAQHSDLERESEAFVDWWCCDNCNIWMHHDCLSSKHCPICSEEIQPNESEII